MRFTHLCAVAFAASPAFASVCKPRASSGSSTTSEGVIISSVTGNDIETTASPTTDLSSTIATSTIEHETTTETSAASATSSYADTTSAEFVSTTTTTTTQAAWEPLATFDIVAKGSQVDGQDLTTYSTPGFFVGWQIQGGSQGPLTFSEVSSNLLQDSNGNTLCIQYGDGESQPNYLKTCSANMLRMPDHALVTCEQTRDRTLECSVAAKVCTSDFETGDTTCEILPGKFDSFFTWSGRADGIWLVMASASSLPAGNKYQAVKLGVTES